MSLFHKFEIRLLEYFACSTEITSTSGGISTFVEIYEVKIGASRARAVAMARFSAPPRTENSSWRIAIDESGSQEEVCIDNTMN